MAAAVVILALSMAGAPGPVVLDRVAAAVGRDVVTLSGILRHLRYESVMSGLAVADTEGNRRRAANQLVDLLIVRREIELSRYTQPTMAQAEEAIRAFLEESHLTRPQFLALLQKYGFDEEQFQREMQARLAVMRFIEYRFAPGIQVSDEETGAYYQNEFLPQFRLGNPEAPPPPLGGVREAIQKILTARKVNTALDEWLAQMRQSLGIRYFDEAFRPEAGAR